MDQNISNSFNVRGQKPLDSKSISKNLETLVQSISANPSIYFDFYKGLKIYLQDEGLEIIWEEVNEINIPDTILASDYTYPSNSFYESFDYSGRTFNFFYTSGVGNLSGSYADGLITDNNQNYI